MRFINETKYESPRNNEARKQFLKNKTYLIQGCQIGRGNYENTENAETTRTSFTRSN